MYDPLSANSAERYAALTAHGFSPDQINEIEQAREFSSYQTHRPTSSYLEGIMLRPFLVLNHGFIRVIDYMGDQAAVVQAARVSYGHGAKSFREDSALMRYMLRHAHGTPFEMCEIKFHVKLPIFIARQWIRHRTACLAADTLLHFDSPNGTPHTITFEKFYKMWHKKVQQRGTTKRKPTYVENINAEHNYSIPELAGVVGRREETLRNMIREGHLKASHVTVINPREPSIFVNGADWIEWANTRSVYTAPNRREQLVNMRLRMLDEETNEIDNTSVVDIWQSGFKHVYQVELSSGHKICMTKKHRCFTDKGWLQLKELFDFDSGKACARMCVSSPKGKNSNYSEPIDIDLATEQWRWIPGYKGDYKVSTFGRIKSYKWGRKTIKTPTLVNGYFVVSLQKKGKQRTKFVHDLVLKTWVSYPKGNRQFCRHLNANRQDNRPANLCWGTKAENASDTVLHENTTKLRGEFVDVISVKYVGKQMTYDLEVAGPYHNFVADGVIVHNSVNEYSARYSILDKEFYIPEPEQLAAQSVSNRQGRSEILDAEEAARVLEILRDDSARNYDHYVDMLNEGEGRDPTRKGLARELSRMNLTLNTYTQWYWKCDLRNLLGFLELRADSHAQHEIKVYADIMLHHVVKNWLPDIYQAFMDYNVNSFNFSGPMMDVLRDIVVCKVRLEELPTFVVPSRYPNLNLSKRECDEMVAAIRNRTE